MRVKKVNPKDLAEALLDRSTCSVQVAAVLADKHGVFSWGWNSVGFDGYGLHAEHHCLLRSNKKRLKRATMFVASRRKRSNNAVCSKPCPQCETIVQRVGRVVYRDKDNKWKLLER